MRETGRGYPNIESLKALSKFFSVSIDELLRGEDLLDIAEEENKQRINRMQNTVFCILDIASLLFLFLPLFGVSDGTTVLAVPLLGADKMELYLRIVFFALICILTLYGLAGLFIKSENSWVSMLLSSVLLLVCILSTQPYAGAFVFIFVATKAIILIKNP